MRTIFFITAVITVLAMQACKTCPANQEIADVMAEVFAGHALCGGGKVIVSDVNDVVADFNYCSEDFDSQAMAKAIPDGAWSAKAGVCYMASQKIKSDLAGKFPPAWLCKKLAYPEEEMRKACQELE